MWHHRSHDHPVWLSIVQKWLSSIRAEYKSTGVFSFSCDHRFVCVKILSTNRFIKSWKNSDSRHQHASNKGGDWSEANQRAQLLLLLSADTNSQLMNTEKSTHNPLCPIQHDDISSDEEVFRDAPHLLVRDEKMVSSQDHVAAPPQLSEDPAAAELPDPAHFLRLLDRLLPRVLNALKHHNTTAETPEEDEDTPENTMTSWNEKDSWSKCSDPNCCERKHKEERKKTEDEGRRWSRQVKKKGLKKREGRKKWGNTVNTQFSAMKRRQVVDKKETQDEHEEEWGKGGGGGGTHGCNDRRMRRREKTGSCRKKMKAEEEVRRKRSQSVDEQDWPTFINTNEEDSWRFIVSDGESDCRSGHRQTRKWSELWTHKLWLKEHFQFGTFSSLWYQYFYCFFSCGFSTFTAVKDTSWSHGGNVKIRD